MPARLSTASKAHRRFRETVTARILQAEEAQDGIILTSRLSWLECRVAPMRDGNAELLATYNRFFTRRLVEIAEISAAVITKATELRCKYGLKTPDAIHVATAIECHADILLSGDKALARCGEIRVEII